MNTERDKFLTEAMEEEFSQYTHEIYKENNFSTWEGFGKLWEWAQKQEWWASFVYKMAFEFQWQRQVFCEAMIHPDRFANAIYVFLKELA